MEYEWDSTKAASNARKHGVQFADAVSVLEDDQALTMRDDNSDEERWLTLGMDGVGRVLVVVYTWRGEAARIISARPAAPAELLNYTENR